MATKAKGKASSGSRRGATRAARKTAQGRKARAANPTKLRNVILDETAVFFLDPGTSLKLINCELRGGAVVVCDPEYDLRQGPLNAVTLRRGTRIGGGEGGLHPNIGLLAPTTQFKAPTCVGIAGVTGITYVNEVKALHQLEIVGQMIVHNQIDHLAYGEVRYDPDIVENPPPGFDYFGGAVGELTLVNVREVFDESHIPDA